MVPNHVFTEKARAAKRTQIARRAPRLLYNGRRRHIHGGGQGASRYYTPHHAKAHTCACRVQRPGTLRGRLVEERARGEGVARELRTYIARDLDERSRSPLRALLFSGAVIIGRRGGLTIRVRRARSEEVRINRRSNPPLRMLAAPGQKKRRDGYLDDDVIVHGGAAVSVPLESPPLVARNPDP
ncbi:hypothetical protein MRX96_016413 [Rhipicephalus microplus]